MTEGQKDLYPTLRAYELAVETTLREEIPWLRPQSLVSRTFYTGIAKITLQEPAEVIDELSPTYNLFKFQSFSNQTQKWFLASEL